MATRPTLSTLHSQAHAPARPIGRSDDWARTLAVATLDAFAWWAAFGFTAIVEEFSDNVARVVILALTASVTQWGTGLATGLYRRRYRPLSFEEVGAVGASIAAAGAAQLLIDRLLGPPDFGHRCVWATAVAVTLALGHRYARRLRARWVASRRARGRTPVVVVGAGDGGYRAIRAMLSAAQSPYRPVAIVDDDSAKASVRIMGIRVAGTTSDLRRVASDHGAVHAVVAVPSLTVAAMQNMHRKIQGAGLGTLVLPPVQHLARRGRQATFVPYEDAQVLNRQIVDIDTVAVSELIADRVVAVTGAGGSIGSELARQVAALHPRTLLLIDHDDSALHHVMATLPTSPSIMPRLADIRDRARIDELFADFQPDIVFHAAALKHVPALETSPGEAWKSNVIGTIHVASAAARCGTQRFVNISTDKAAEPISVLGKTKRVSERIVSRIGHTASRPFVSVRFGNVIGSRGSVIETFQQQIEAGGPVTVTHPDVSRYFMAIREAVRLTMQAAVIGATGEVLILDMGEPVRIVDVANQLIRESGHDIEIAFIGLRPGEKLHETLVAPHERVEHRHHPLISHTCVEPADVDPDAVYDDATLAALSRE